LVCFWPSFEISSTDPPPFRLLFLRLLPTTCIIDLSCEIDGGDFSSGMLGETGKSFESDPLWHCGMISPSSSSDSSLGGSRPDSQRPLILRILAASYWKNDQQLKRILRRTIDSISNLEFVEINVY
jgi:hypothetical protein